jgi:hypothetical protein
MKNYFVDLDPTPKGQLGGGGGLVASRCISVLITILLDQRNTATTKTLDFKNSNLISVGAKKIRCLFLGSLCCVYRTGRVRI